MDGLLAPSMLQMEHLARNQRKGEEERKKERLPDAPGCWGLYLRTGWGGGKKRQVLGELARTGSECSRGQ